MDRSPRPSRQRGLDYRLLNDGSDEEASFEDRIQELHSVPSDELIFGANSPDCEILSSQSISQNPTSPVTVDSSSSIISEDSCTIQPRNIAARATEGPKARGSQTVISVAFISMNRLGSDVIGRLQIRQGKLQLQTWQDIWRSIQSTLPNLAGNRILQSSNFSKGTFYAG
ncbi:hypothetical protein POJ06DRAFT_294847 [Lipomyces tetrasporus]|uniref:Uncharacterized protein n=1 Tax=Lipomyces tetrasporus TaxID=54092 RepID=A0AAD7QWV7_9ASCO|nr:uncharacterized protein POJ06DRAFT_294847 [Lipomyces tetrasporus]KAJ8102381.1 hypothetical protein POJ06DRAFT_294847 [Lipomyces tetrasporus]